MFTDCIVHNRGAIAEPWREYRTEGNAFSFSARLRLCGLVGFGALAFFSCLAATRRNRHADGAAIVLGVAWLLVAILFGLVTHFMVPVMYRQRCGAISFRRSAR